MAWQNVAVPGATVENSRSYALWIVESQKDEDKCLVPDGFDPSKCWLYGPIGGLAKFLTPIEFHSIASHKPGVLQLHQFNIDGDNNGNPIEQKAEVHPRDISGAFTIEWRGW